MILDFLANLRSSSEKSNSSRVSRPCRLMFFILCKKCALLDLLGG
jgi:hypothetical protein